MIDTSKKYCSILFDTLSARGVREIICSPGSRNAPLLIGAAARENLKKYVVIDERSAGFMALGMSIIGRRPVALICTSGTALLNYAPAVAEAFYQGVPLIVISADRPAQWIDQDDSQTLRQFEALSNYVKKSYQFPADSSGDEEMEWYVNRIVNDALIEATTGRSGPVHINIPLDSPLGKKIERNYEPQRIIDVIEADGIINQEELRHLAKELASARVMFIAGFMPPDAEMQKGAALFCKLPNVSVMAETLSNLHIDTYAHDIDAVLTAFDDSFLDSVAPDIVISVGGSLVSRKLKEYLRRNRSRCRHWVLGRNHTTIDCFMSLTKRIEAEPARFLSRLSGYCRRYCREKTPSYKALWEELKVEAYKAKSHFIENIGWSELRVFNIMSRLIPKSINLFLSNGTPVRYAQISGPQNPHASYCNRGVSGIDGSTSTAVGAAIMYKGSTLLITGDTSFSYDINGLALPDIPDTMKIVLIDNSGGGIFRFIPSTKDLEERENYFCVSRPRDYSSLAQGFGWDYERVEDEKSFRSSFKSLLSSDRKKILHVVCPAVESSDILKEYMTIKV